MTAVTLTERAGAHEGSGVMPGSTIGRYAVHSLIGQGGMGVVYAAYDMQLDRKVALKVLRRSRAPEDSEEARTRLLREAQAMARLSHPNVVAIHDVGTFEGDVFLAMEHVDGGTLKQWLATPHPWRERLEVMKAAGRGLAAAHEAGLIHRDFKPDNILIGRDGRVRVADFGLSRADGSTPNSPPGVDDATVPCHPASEEAPPSAPSEKSHASNVASASSMEARPSSNPPSASGSSAPLWLHSPLTREGSLLGTIGYMAPEQAFGEKVDARSDQFSYCVTLYVALYSERPFPGRTLEEYLRALARPVREPRGRSDVPAWVRQIVLKGLSDVPEERYPSMDALLAALERDPAIVRRRWLAAGAVAASLAAVGGLYARSVRQQSLACVGAEQELASGWNDAVKDEVRRAFVATGAPMAADSFERAAKTLDAYGAGWVTMSTASCEATKLNKTQPEDVRVLRAECLDRHKAEMTALTSLFRQADRKVVETSVKAAHELPALSWCADVRALRASPGLPSDPVKRAAVTFARAQLVESTALYRGGKFKEALPLAERARKAASDASHGGAEAEALLLIGDIQEKLHDDEAAERTLSEAVWMALAAGSDPVVVRGAALAAFVDGPRLQRLREAKTWIGLAEASLKRMGGNDELEAYLAAKHGNVLASVERRPDLAVPLFERAERADRRILGVHPDTAAAVYNLAHAYRDVGRFDAALAKSKEALELAEQLYGPEAPRLSIFWHALCTMHLSFGELAEASGACEHARGIFARNGDAFWEAAALAALAEAIHLTGDSERALGFVRRARSLSEKLGDPDASMFAFLSDVLIASGRADEALPLCDVVLAFQEKNGHIDPERVYHQDALRCRGDALVALGRASEALAPLERSITLPRRTFAPDLARARFALARALVESHGDGARAVALARQAREELERFPQLRVPREAIDAWLAAHAPPR